MLQLIRRMDSHVPVVVMTAFGTVENAVRGDEIRRQRFSPEAVFSSTS